MAQNRHPAQIFNHDLRAIRRERATRRYQAGHAAFILKLTGEIAAEKIIDVNRRFQRAVIIGLPAFEVAFMDSLPGDRKPATIVSYRDWPDVWPENIDLVVSGLVLQSRNDIPELIKSARLALVPDGLFIASILGGETLLGLRRACFAVDQKQRGGAIPRVSPMIDLRQSANLLSHAAFAQPVTDRDKLNMNYKSLKALVEDLRDIGETNCLLAFNLKFSGRAFLSELESCYAERSENGKLSVRLDIIWMSGWVPHASQQKPLKPGSAKMRLSDALKDIQN